MKTLPLNLESVETLEKFFAKEHKKIKRNISLSALSILLSEKINTREMAAAMGTLNGQNFESNEMRVYRLLKSKDFQVNDRLFRGHIDLLFSLLKENGLKKRERITLNVDMTSDRDDFLILYASVVFRQESIPLYFSMRKYPKKKGQMDQKTMERAFFKALKHLLPDSYEYEVVADRGFGNLRIIEILENLNFKYILRISDSLTIEDEGKRLQLSELKYRNTNRTIWVNSWNRSVCLVKKTEGDSCWNLFVSPETENAVKKYENRFLIEKMFKNKKSGGFDLERLLIDKYDRFKRILFISCVAYVLYVFIGFWIRNKVHPIKKNYFLHLKILSAFSV